MTTLTGVGCVLSVSHDPVNADVFGGEPHGHSYLVKVFFDCPDDIPRDVRVCQQAVNTLHKMFDHRKLPAHLSTAEAIGKFFGTLANVVEVHVDRPLEMFYSIWRSDGGQRHNMNPPEAA
jgi:6-pyruvoyl-tetrahydropterin synthase